MVASEMREEEVKIIHLQTFNSWKKEKDNKNES